MIPLMLCLCFVDPFCLPDCLPDAVPDLTATDSDKKPLLEIRVGDGPASGGRDRAAPTHITQVGKEVPRSLAKIGCTDGHCRVQAQADSDNSTCPSGDCPAPARRFQPLRNFFRGRR